MEKSYKKSCKSAIYALAIIVAGACTLAQPAFGLSCFLPSGNCGGGGVGISNQDDCSKYEISKEEYEAEYMNNCWSCSGCNDKKTNKTTYSCTLKTGSELGDWVWKNKKCCKNGNCGNCQPPLKWDDDREACVCENAGEVYHSDANMCCPSGQSPSDGMCCPSGQHNSSGHCCPRDQHYNGTECVCDEPLIGDGNGGCRPRDCAGYNLSSEYNLKCFDCEKCPDDETKIKCTAKTLSSSWEVNADTGACRLKSCSDLGYLTESESCEKNKKKTPVDGVEASDGPCYSCGDQTCEQIDSSYRTSCSSSEITHPTEDAGSNGPCVTCEPDPCDSSYNQENKLDENCFSCTQCTKTGSNYENKWYCQQNIKENYIVEGTTCRLKTCKEINSDYVTTCPAGYACRDTQIDGSDGDCLTTQACTYGTNEKCKQAGEWVGTCKQDSDGCWWPETCNNAKGYAKQASDCGGGAFTTGAQAGKLGKDGSGAACYRIGCNESAGYYADLGSYDTTVFKESAYKGCGLTCKQPSCVNNISNQSDCKTTGSAGYDLEGPKVLKKVNCYTCKAKTCPDGYEKGKTAANCADKEGYVVTYASSSIYAGNDVCGKCEECTLNPCSGYTYTTLSDYANSESCDRGCDQGKKYRCKSGYTYSNGKCVPVPVTPVCNKGEYASKTACETNHPDTICTQNSSTKCWIGKCDTKNYKYYYESKEACYEWYQDQCYDCNLKPCEQEDEDSNCWFINCEKIGFYNRESDCQSKSPTGNCTFDAGLGCYMPDEVTCDNEYGLFATETECEHFGLEGPARCTKEGNCYRPDVFRVNINYATDHNPLWQAGDLRFGSLRFYRDGNYPNRIAYKCVDYDCGDEELYAGTYTIETYGARAAYNSMTNKGIWITYVEEVDMTGAPNENINFSPDNHGDEQDMLNGLYAMTPIKKYYGASCVTTGEVGLLYGTYYRYTMQYKFKGGITYSISVHDENSRHKGENTLETICCKNKSYDYRCNDSNKTPIYGIEGADYRTWN